jgi:uncharacterized membrane protein
MVLMAIDHVRVFAGVPAGGPTPALFFTRWVTHYCAPGFAFLAGTAIFFHAQKLDNKNRLSKFLVTRGLLLVLLEETVIRFFWSLNFDYSHFFLAGVIWMLGWCVVLMALLVRLKPAVTGVIGVVIIAAQQGFRYVPLLIPHSFRESFSGFWNFIYPTAIESREGVFILYVLVPWIGVMAAGYGFGLIQNLATEKRRKVCLWMGLSFIVLFLVIGSVLVLRGNPSGEAPPFIFRLLNQNKYPASQLFLLMTLGPLIALMPFAERAKGWLADVLALFGKAPMFYYLLHIPLIHLSAFVVNLIRDGKLHQEWYHMAPFFTTQPEGVRWGLGVLYLVFIIDVIILYFVCKWYVKYKRDHADVRWLKYI